MKLLNNSRVRSREGISLVECIVYIAVFLLLSGSAMGAFYLCWDRSRALISATDDISAALRAGERWRADVRDASGSITVQQISSGQVVTIPEGEKEVVYRFDSGEVRRTIGTGNAFQLLLPKVITSEMKPDMRGGLTAWRWELEVAQRRKETHMPLLFTFEAVPKMP